MMNFSMLHAEHAEERVIRVMRYVCAKRKKIIYMKHVVDASDGSYLMHYSSLSSDL